MTSATPAQQGEQFESGGSARPRGPQAGPRLDERVARTRHKRAPASIEAPIEQNKGSPGSKSRVTWTPGSAAMAADRAVQTRKEEDMRQPAKVWTDPGFEQESLERLRQEFKRQNLTGTRKLSPFSVRKYDQTLEDFIRSLERHGIEPVLGELTVDNVALWQRDQQERGNSPHSISSRVIALKVFSNKFVFKTLELTTADLLRKVQRPTPKLEEPEILSPEETLSLVESFDLDTFEHIRDRGFVAVLAATGLRFNAVRTMHLGDYDRVTGEFKVHEKGDEDRPAVIDGRARRYLNLYLARRPRKTDAEQLWVTETGEPLSYWGAQNIIRRARKLSGIERVHSHLFRHGIAHRAADQGAHPGEIQLLLGHASTAMAARYTGAAAKRQGARLMPQYSPI
jgi:integrase/recombinase XerD